MNQEELFIQKNSPSRALNHAVQGEFLQSEEWRKFQEAVGRRTFCITSDKDVKSQSNHVPSFHASIIEHQLPIVGRYFYVPHGPLCHPERAERVEGSNKFDKLDSSTTLGMTELINLAKKNNISWIRIEPKDTEILDTVRNSIEINGNKLRIIKAPHDVQPREILVMDITKPEEELLAGMKSKTRYNIKVAQKHSVSVKVISNFQFPISNDQNSKFYIDKFIELVKITAERDKIIPHPESYYRKMFEIIPPEILKLYIAEYEGKIIAANIVIHYGNTATYLHGASDNNFRNVMAPHLLQWQAILDAKKAGLTKYDLGGVSTNYESLTNKWRGITRFKLGFSPNTKPIEFPGSYDIVLDKNRYMLYTAVSRVKKLIQAVLLSRSV